jgi:NADPH:quinone reductase-like Zn-dependent oxidoreductase
MKNTQLRKAVIRENYGGPEKITVTDLAMPILKPDKVIIKVMANAINAADWHILRGEPKLARLALGLFKPKEKILGVDFAGTVEQVGEKVTHLKLGDAVFGESLSGAVFAEYACVPASVCALIPKELPFLQMACLPVAGLTAYQALITHGKLTAGENVLVHGASGGVGHFAVQIAKAYGAAVTAVCSSAKVDFVKNLGADKVIAYDKENIFEHNGKYNLVLDTHGSLRFADYTRMGDRGVMTGFTTATHMMKVVLRSVVSKFSIKQFTAKSNVDDLNTLASLLANGKLKVHIDKTFTCREVAEAIRIMELMRTKGKLAISWQ